MKKLYPSSAAFMWGNLVITKYDSGCLRRILLTANDIRTDINPVFGVIGDIHEDNYMKNLKMPIVVKELPFKRKINDDVVQSGRVDFRTKGKIWLVHECKSITSINGRRDVIKNSIVNINNLAQIVSYMIHFDTHKGVIPYGFYEEAEDGSFVMTDSRLFRVQIENYGEILVNGTDTGFNVKDQMLHTLKAGEVISKDIVWERPNDAHKKFNSPCNFCAFKFTCDRWDSNELQSVEEFFESAREEIQGFIPFEPKIKKVKKKKVKK